MDIVPSREAIGFAPLEVPDRTQKEWVATNPRGHTAWVTELNKKSKDKDTDQGRFVPLVKMMKYWRGYQLPTAKHPKGFWTEVLSGNNHDVSKRDWADVFIDCLEQIKSNHAFAYALKVVPLLKDPGLPYQNLQTGIESAEFCAFYEKVVASLDLAKRRATTRTKPRAQRSGSRSLAPSSRIRTCAKRWKGSMGRPRLRVRLR